MRKGATLGGSVSSAVLLGDKQATVSPWKKLSMAPRSNAQSSLLSAVMTVLDAVRSLAVEGMMWNDTKIFLLDRRCCALAIRNDRWDGATTIGCLCFGCWSVALSYCNVLGDAGWHNARQLYRLLLCRAVRWMMADNEITFSSLAVVLVRSRHYCANIVEMLDDGCSTSDAVVLELLCRWIGILYGGSAML